MKNKKEKIKRNIKNVIFIGIIILCVVNFIILIKVKSSLYDTFYVDDVYFTYHQDETYTMSFRAISAQNKSYSDDTLYFYFNCYDKNGVLVTDGVQVEMDGNALGALMFYNSGDERMSYISSDSISYCELNYVLIYRNNKRIINSL